MAKVKCKYCGKEIDKKNAFIVPVSAKRNNYYCCEEHSKLLSDRDLFYKKAMDIFGQTTNTVFYTEFDGISKVHSWYKMKSYLEDNEDYLRYVLSKIDGSEYRVSSEKTGVKTKTTVSVLKLLALTPHVSSDTPLSMKQEVTSLLNRCAGRCFTESPGPMGWSPCTLAATRGRGACTQRIRLVL